MNLFIRPNSYTDIARRIMMAGLKRQYLSIPKRFFALAQEMFNVPEKPLGYQEKNSVYFLERVVLVTGGLDSSVLYFRLKKDFPNLRAVYINIGQPYLAKEIIALKQLGIEHETVVDLSFAEYEKDYWKHIIPARNFYFLCLVAEQMKGGIIYFASTDGEMPEVGGDKSKRFLKWTNELFTKLPYPVRIETPLENETKTDEVKWWKENLPIEQLDYTMSCFEAEIGHCGHCQSCLRKAIAYANNGLKLRTNTPILEGTQEYIAKYKTLMPEALKKKDFSHYSRRRCIQDLRGIELLEKQ